MNEVIINTKQTTEGYQLVKTDITKQTKVESVALAGTEKKECYNAQNLLNMLFTGEILLEVPVFDLSKSASLPAETTTLLPVEEEVLLYPNPAKNIVTVELLLAENEQAQIVLFNMLGEQVFATTVTQDRSYIELNDLPAGTYFLQITLPTSNQLFKKLVIQK